MWGTHFWRPKTILCAAILDRPAWRPDTGRTDWTRPAAGQGSTGEGCIRSAATPDQTCRTTWTSRCRYCNSNWRPDARLHRRRRRRRCPPPWTSACETPSVCWWPAAGGRTPSTGTQTWCPRAETAARWTRPARRTCHWRPPRRRRRHRTRTWCLERPRTRKNTSPPWTRTPS